MSISLRSIYFKPTLGLLIGSFAVIYSVPAFFYSLTLGGGESLIALLYLYLFLAGTITIIIDRWLINVFPKIIIVSVLEVIFFSLISIKFKYDDRKAIINIVNAKNNYTIVIKDSNGLNIDKFIRKELFDKQINFADNTGIIYLNDKSLSEYTVDFQGIGVSQTIHSGYKPEYNYNWEFICDDNKYNYSDERIDSLVQAALGLGASLHNPNFRSF